MSNITRSTGITSHLLDKVWPHLSLLQVQDLHCLMRGQLACSRHRLCAFQSPRPRICDDKTQESRQNRAYSVLDRHPTGIRIARIAVTSMSSKKLREISGKQPSVKLNRNDVCDQGTHARNYPPGMNKAYPRYNLFFLALELRLACWTLLLYCKPFYMLILYCWCKSRIHRTTNTCIRVHDYTFIFHPLKVVFLCRGKGTDVITGNFPVTGIPVWLRETTFTPWPSLVCRWNDDRHQTVANSSVMANTRGRQTVVPSTRHTANKPASNNKSKHLPCCPAEIGHPSTHEHPT